MRLSFLILGTFAAIAIGCGGSPEIVVNDDGVSAGGVSIDTLVPARGPLTGGQDITITGSGFAQGSTEVAIGDMTALAVAVVSSSELRVRTPAGVDANAVDVFVFTSVGFASRIDGYAYNPLPTVTNVTANRGPKAGGNTVTITGTGFQALDAGTNVVDFGPYQSSSVTVVSDTEISAVAPPSGRPFERVDVKVTNVNGPGTLADGYAYFSRGFIAARSQVRRAGLGELYHVSADTGEASLIAASTTSSGAPAFYTALAFDPASPETLYAYERSTSSLYTVDFATGVGTLVGSLAGTSALTGLTFRGGVLYGMRRQPEVRLIAIDKNDGQVTDFNAESLPCCAGGALATNAAANLTLFTFGSQMAPVDVATGTIGTTVSFPGGGLKGLAFLGNDLFALERISIAAVGGGGIEASALVRLDPSLLTKETIGVVPRMCAMAAVGQ